MSQLSPRRSGDDDADGLHRISLRECSDRRQCRSGEQYDPGKDAVHVFLLADDVRRPLAIMQRAGHAVHPVFTGCAGTQRDITSTAIHDAAEATASTA
jgi:hypothetical protein